MIFNLFILGSNGIGKFSISSINLRYGGKLLINNMDDSIEMQIISGFIELKFNSTITIKRKIEFNVGNFDLEPLSYIDLSGSGINYKYIYI